MGSHRLNPLITPPVERSPVLTLSLQEVIIVGNVADQVKFSELTLDMFRMLQTLEKEPQDELAQVYDSSPAPGRVPLENGGVMGRRENPHKYLLYNLPCHSCKCSLPRATRSCHLMGLCFSTSQQTDPSLSDLNQRTPAMTWV